MKLKEKLIKAMFVLTLLFAPLAANAQTTQDDWGTLIAAISQVESGNNPNSVNGRHVGVLQISPITVDECNRILKKKKYTYKDRYNREKSIEMFEIIQHFYNPTKNIDVAIRLWNGGPRYSVKGTARYHAKVKGVYEKLKNKRQ